MGRDGAFAEDHPRAAAAGEVNDRRRNRAGSRATVDDEWDLIAELGADELRVGTLRHAAQVGGGGGDGDAETGDYCAGYCGFGNTQGDVAGIGGDAQGKACPGLDDDGERAGPEAFRQAIEGGVDIAGQAIGLCGFGYE